jgi:hypothetical protein
MDTDEVTIVSNPGPVNNNADTTVSDTDAPASDETPINTEETVQPMETQRDPSKIIDIYA